MRTTVATLLLLVLAAVATGGEARSGDGGSARQLLTNPEPPSCHDSKCDKALKYGCEWLPKAYLKCDKGDKYKVPVKNCFKDKVVSYISISVGDKCYKASSYGDVLVELELKCGEEIFIYGYDKHLKGDGSIACSVDNSRKAGGDYCKTCKYPAKYDCGHPAHPGDVCREAYGDCDVAEKFNHYCNCPKDAFKPNTTECRPAYGECDVAEYCTGYKAKCPKDKFKSKETKCRPAADTCDEAEYCTGYKAKCPKDKFKPVHTPCRGKYGKCDVADYCDGYHAECFDKVADNTTVCREKAGPCDAEEKCDGSSKSCPTDYCVDYKTELTEKYPYCPNA